MSGGQIKTLVRGQAQQGQDNRFATAAGVPSRRERDDNYWGVIVVLNDRFRVIIDEPCDQFIVQKHYAESLHGDVWRGQSYLTTKDSLMKACVRLGCLSGSNQWLLLDALPSTVREYAARIGLPR
ncbi:MAG: hypothetical protein MUR46_10165 [Loktanella sp.]|nr:hypothetical protein [Loktanella sp.]